MAYLFRDVLAMAAMLTWPCNLQVWPDYLHEPKFPQSILQPGETYTHKWYLQFYTKPAGGAAPAPAPTEARVGTAEQPAMAPAHAAGDVHTASIP